MRSNVTQHYLEPEGGLPAQMIQLGIGGEMEQVGLPRRFLIDRYTCLGITQEFIGCNLKFSLRGRGQGTPRS